MYKELDNHAPWLQSYIKTYKNLKKNEPLLTKPTHDQNFWDSLHFMSGGLQHWIKDIVFDESNVFWFVELFLLWIPARKLLLNIETYLLSWTLGCSISECIFYKNTFKKCVSCPVWNAFIEVFL